MRRNVSTGGTAGPGLVSVMKPNAPPCAVSASQYAGGTQSYGPVILTPVAPDTGVARAVAEERYGLGQRSSVSTSTYIRSMSGGGGLSLPLSQTNTLGCVRSRVI